jgi:hypothetical protein
VKVRVCRPTGCVELFSKYVVIATGSRPHRAKEISPGVTIPFTSNKVVDATQVGPDEPASAWQLAFKQPVYVTFLQISNTKDLPDSMAVLGG